MGNKNAAEILLTVCAGAQKDEKILFVSDDTSAEIADIMWRSSTDYKNRSMTRMIDRKMHGEEPTATVAAAMLQADVIFGITKFSMFHTAARREAVANGARFVNMADYSKEMLSSGGLFVDFEKQGALMDLVSDRLEGETIRITTALGTDLTASICGRKAVRQYGRSLVPGASSSPPDIETAIGPVEGTANGISVIDGSIPFPGLGVLTGFIKMTIKDGVITKIEGGGEAEVLEKGLADLDDPYAYHIAEVGFGFNDSSVFCNRMLEDEGVMGTVHFGFGNNISFGGSVGSKNHIDMVFTKPSVWVDGRRIMENGEYIVD